MGKGNASFTMNYEINLLGLSTKLTGKEHLSFPMIQDAPTEIPIPEPDSPEVSEEVKEKKKPWWKRGIEAVKKVAVTVTKVIAASAAVVAVATVGALALAAVPIAVGATTVGAVLGSVAATTAISWGAAALGAAAVGVYDVVTGMESKQEIYDIAANVNMAAVSITLTAGAIKDLAGALTGAGPLSGPPGLSFAGEAVLEAAADAVVSIYGLGVIEAGLAGAFGAIGVNALFSLGKGGSGSGNDKKPKKGNSDTKYPKSDKDFKKIFKVDIKTYHKYIKPNIIKDIKNSVEYAKYFFKVGDNPDVGINSLGQIVLKNVKTGVELVTKYLFEWYLP